LKQTFIDNGGIVANPVDPRSMRVAQVDPKTGKVIRFWNTRNAVIENFAIRAKVLRTTITYAKVFRGLCERMYSTRPVITIYLVVIFYIAVAIFVDNFVKFLNN
jgi:hypothetical protein